MKRVKAKQARRVITRADFVGAQMSNSLYAIAHDKRVPQELRSTASELYQKWDSIATFRLENPIVACELQREFFKDGKTSVAV